MCSAWLINGRYCKSGQDLIDALGIESAKRVNEGYEDVGEIGWEVGPNGERIEYVITEGHVKACCLCSVSVSKMDELTGKTWEYDIAEDAFVSRPSPL